MSDQSILQPVSNTNRTPSSHTGSEVVRARVGQIRKRFRRGATGAGAGRDVVEQISGTAVEVRGDAPGVPAIRPRRTIVSRRDVWDLLPPVSPGVRRHFLSGAPLVNFFRNDPAARAFDLLRTRLLQTLRDNGWSRIAIASPTSGCGATFTAVNLAQSLARVPGSRTVLMDINHRTPGIADLLEIDQSGDMRGFLSGDVPLENHLMRASKTLALGLATPCDTGAAEILHDARCGETLGQMHRALRPDVTLYDLPPILAHDDLAAFLPQVDGVLLVVDGTETTATQIAACERVLDGQTQLLGIILNRARKSEG